MRLYPAYAAAAKTPSSVECLTERAGQNADGWITLVSWGSAAVRAREIVATGNESSLPPQDRRNHRPVGGPHPGSIVRGSWGPRLPRAARVADLQKRAGAVSKMILGPAAGDVLGIVISRRIISSRWSGSCRKPARVRSAREWPGIVPLPGKKTARARMGHRGAVRPGSCRPGAR